MTDPVSHDITEMLQAWRQGDEHALDRLTPQVYRELHRAAKRCMMAERDGHSMQTTGLINGTTRTDHIVNRVGVGTGVYSLGTPRQIEFGLRLTF